MSHGAQNEARQKLVWQLLLISYLSGILGGPVFGQEAVTQEETIRVDVNLVTLRFSAKGPQGSFINSLELGDFKILENGVRYDIAFFQRPRAAIGQQKTMWLAFLLDVSGSTFATRNEEILAARTFFENVNDFTKVGVFGFTDQLITFQDFTEDRNLAVEAFGSAQSHLGKTAIYQSLDSLVATMDRVSGPTESKVIIVVSDAMDDEYRRAVATASHARRANTILYTIWVPSAAQLYIGPASRSGRGNSDLESKRIKAAKEAAFSRISPQTGGRHFGGFEAILDFDGVLAEINDEIFGNLYSLGYYTEDPHLDRLERNITLSVNQPDVYLSGIFKDVPDRDRAKREIIEAFFDSEAPSGLQGRSSVPLHEIGVELDLLRPRQDGEKSVLPFRLKISPYSLQRTKSGDLNTQFGVLALLSDSFGKQTVHLREIFRGRISSKEIIEVARGVIYTNRLQAPPGRYNLKLAVMEIPTWKMTVLERRIRIP
jgi:VWFA-related protein